LPANSSFGDIPRAGCIKATRDYGRLEKEHHGRSGSKFSYHTTKSDAEFSETIAGNELTTMDVTSKTLHTRSELL
jgi:hypothetical protein